MQTPWVHFEKKNLGLFLTFLSWTIGLHNVPTLESFLQGHQRGLHWDHSNVHFYKMTKNVQNMTYPGLVSVRKAALAGAWLTRNAMRLMMRYV